MIRLPITLLLLLFITSCNNEVYNAETTSLETENFDSISSLENTNFSKEEAKDLANILAASKLGPDTSGIVEVIEFHHGYSARTINKGGRNITTVSLIGDILGKQTKITDSSQIFECSRKTLKDSLVIKIETTKEYNEVELQTIKSKMISLTKKQIVNEGTNTFNINLTALYDGIYELICIHVNPNYNKTLKINIITNKQ